MSDTPSVLRGGDDTVDDNQPAPDEEGDHGKPEDWMMPARMGGTEWGDIADHVSGATEAALSDGHTQQDVDRYLGYSDNGVASDWMQKNFDHHYAAEPPKPGAISPATSPTMREDYARALNTNGVKDAADFADTYTSAALTAANSRQDGEHESPEKVRQAAAAAEALATQLPSRTDFVDAAAKIADDPEEAERIRKKLIDKWKETGIKPTDAIREMPEQLNVHAGGDDPGFVLRNVLGTGKAVTSAWDGMMGLPNLLGKGFDQIWDHTIGGDGGEGWITRNTHWNVDLAGKYEKGLGILDSMLGGSGKVDISPHSPWEEHLQDIAGNIIALGPVGLNARAALTIAGFTEGQKAYNAIRPPEDQSPLEQIGSMAVMGLVAHVGAGKALNLYSPKEAGGAVREVPAEQYTKDELAHAEAREQAADPGFMARLAADQSGKFDITGEGGDKEAQKRPKFSLEDKGVQSGLTETGESVPTKSFTIHKDGEPVGFADAAFPKDRPGVAVLENIGASDRAGALGPRAVRDLATQFFDAHPDINTVEGWRVTGARLREGSGPSTMTITRDQIEKHNPAAVKELAEGYHTQGIMARMLEHLGNLSQDEGGALNLGKVKELFQASKSERDLTETSRTAREVFGNSWRGAGGEAKATVRQLARSLQDSKAFQYANKHLPDAEEALKGGNFKTSELGQLWQAIHKDIPIDPMHPMAAPLRLMQDVRDRMHEEAARWHLDGMAPMPDYIKGYASGLWKNPNARWEDGQRLTASPMGSDSYLKDKTYQNIFAGIAAGETPKYLNPFEHFLEEVKNHERQRIKFEMLSDLKDAFPGMPVGHQSNAPSNMVRLYDAEYGSKAAYAPKGFADMWNRLHQRGVLDDPFQEKLYNRFQYAVNAINSLKLLWPMFHLRTILLGTMSDGFSKLQREVYGIGKGMVQGDWNIVADQTQRALWTAASTAMLPIKVGDQLFRYGRNGFKEYETAAQTDVGRAMTRQGFQWGRGSMEYPSRDPSLHISAMQHWQPGEGIAANVVNLGKAVLREQSAKFKEDLGVGREDQSFMTKAVLTPFKIADHVILGEGERAMQTFSHFAFQYLIPRLQAGAIMEAAESWKGRNPLHSEAELNDHVRQLIMDQENRKGELNMVNVFWPKLLKQTANATLLSVGWKFGTYRGLAQAAGWDSDNAQWKPFHNPVAISSVVSTAVAWAGFNAMAQYFHTGTLPTDTDTPWKDLLLFRTGTAGDRLSKYSGGAQVPIRGMNPGEPKEIYDLAHIAFTAMGDPWKTGEAIKEYAMSATNPMWQALLGVTTNEDGVGHHIGNYPGGWSRFLTTQFNPMINESVKQNKVDSNLPQWEVKWFGTREAASWAENPTGWENFLAQQSVKTDKTELKRARKEAAQYQDSEWLQEYIREKEAAMSEGRAEKGAIIPGSRRKVK